MVWRSHEKGFSKVSARFRGDAGFCEGSSEGCAGVFSESAEPTRACAVGDITWAYCNFSFARALLWTLGRIPQN